MSKEEWVLTEQRITDFEFSSVKTFNMLINNQMFDKLEEIANKKKVKEIISLIVSYSIPALQNVKTDLARWKMFQHLLPENIDKAKSTRNIEKNNENQMKNGKFRKHIHHFVSIQIQRCEYEEILYLHNQINTFSMALIIRMMIFVFISLFEKYHSIEKSLKALQKAIKKIFTNKVKANVEFILLKEKLSGTKCWRAVAFFQIEYFDSSKNKKFFLRIRL